MRFSVELFLENGFMPKDKNRIILSLLKSCFQSYNPKYYVELYEDGKNKMKDFTFSLYLGNCRFLREEIEVPGKKVILNFSTYLSEDGIMFFNSFMSNKGKKYSIKNNSITIGRINLSKERDMYDEQVIFKTMSPIVVREHDGDNQKTWYYSLKDEKGQAIFMKNLKYQLYDTFGQKAMFDFDNIRIKVSEDCKIVKVKNYGIEVHANLCKLKINSQPYILDYLYKAGIGSKRGSGFGMINLV